MRLSESGNTVSATGSDEKRENSNVYSLEVRKRIVVRGIFRQEWHRKRPAVREKPYMRLIGVLLQPFNDGKLFAMIRDAVLFHFHQLCIFVLSRVNIFFFFSFIFNLPRPDFSLCPGLSLRRMENASSFFSLGFCHGNLFCHIARLLVIFRVLLL